MLLQMKINILKYSFKILIDLRKLFMIKNHFEIVRFKQVCPQHGFLGAPPFNKSVPPFEGLDYHETLSLVYIIFLKPPIPWLSGLVK